MSLRTPLSPEFSSLTDKIGVYALCDLDDVVIYVGKTVAPKEKGIRGRVRRHLTSARSDIIANMQLDVWEIAYVRAWPISNAHVNDLECHIHDKFSATILAGKQMQSQRSVTMPAEQKVNVLTVAEIIRRQDPRVRFPRQLRHLDHLLDIILNRKDTADQRRSLEAHVKRLQQRYRDFIGFAPPDLEDQDAEQLSKGLG